MSDAPPQPVPMTRPIGKRETAVIAAIIIAHLCITITLAAMLGIDQDEAYSLQTTSGGVAYAVHQALHFEFQPPLYFVALALWRDLDHSIFFARCLSVAFVALALLCAVFLSRRLFPRQSTAWLLIALAFNPTVIWAALDIRVYPLVLLLSTLLLLTFVRGFLDEAVSKQHIAVHAALIVAALYTQYYLVFLVVGLAAALGILRRWRAFALYLACSLVAALAFAPMLPMIAMQASASRANAPGTLSFLGVLVMLAKVLASAIVPLRWMAHHGLVIVAAIVVSAFAYLGWMHWRDRPLRSDRVTAALWLATGVAALSFSFALSAAAQPLIARYAIFLLMPAMACVFGVIALLQERPHRTALRAWTALILAVSFAGLYDTYRPLAKTGDWSRVAAYLQRSEAPDQPILVFEAEAAVPLAHYYFGKNPLVPVPQPVAFDTFDVHRFVLHDEGQLDAALRRVPGRHRRIWLVQTDYCVAEGLSFNCGVLDSFVRRHYSTIQSVAFYGSSVRLLERKPGGVSATLRSSLR